MAALLEQAGTSSAQTQADVADIALRYCSRLRAHGGGAVASTAEGAIVAFLARGLVSSSQRGRIFRRSLLRGQYDCVLATGIPPVAEGYADFKFAVLRADAAATICRAARQSGNTSGAAEMLPACILAYEDAYRKTEDVFLRTQLAAKCWSLNANAGRKFFSKAMGEAFPFGESAGAGMARPDSDAVKRLTDELRESPLTKDMPAELRTAFAECVGRELDLFAVIQISDQTHEALVTGFPQFVQLSLTGFSLKKPERMGRTLRWYTWAALMQSNPSLEDREAVDVLIAEARAAAVSAAKETVSVQWLYDDVISEIERWENSVKAIRDNPWFPYYKIGYYPYQRAQAVRAVVRFIKQIPDITADLNAAEDATEPERNEVRGRVSIKVATALWYNTADYDRPMGRWHMPDGWIRSNRGTVNKHNVFVLSIGKIEPFHPFRKANGSSKER